MSLESNTKYRRLIALSKNELGICKATTRGLLEQLWDVAHTHGPKFRDDVDIEVAAQFDGKPGSLTQLLLRERWLDIANDGSYLIHNYWKHAPHWVRERERKRGTDLEKVGGKLEKVGTDSDPREEKPSEAKLSEGKPREGKDAFSLSFDQKFTEAANQSFALYADCCTLFGSTAGTDKGWLNAARRYPPTDDEWTAISQYLTTRINRKKQSICKDRFLPGPEKFFANKAWLEALPSEPQREEYPDALKF